MDPATHGLMAVTLSRAGLNRATRLAAPILLAAGLAVDFDLLSQSISPRAYLMFHRAATHSILGAGLMVLVIAAVFWRLGRKHPTAPLGFVPVLVVAAIGATGHLLLDWLSGDGLRLLWPFRPTWYARDLLELVDPWILLLLLLGLLLPGLFRLVSEEIGARPAARGSARGAIVALVLVTLYCGARGVLHGRAIELLNSRLYHEASPLGASAFPSAASPLAWSGVVETENTLEEIDVNLGPGSYFDPERARTHYKPEASPILEAARDTETVKRFLEYARFPSARVHRLPEGYLVEVRDLRFPTLSPARRGLYASVELDSRQRVIKEEIRFGQPPKHFD